MKVIPDFITETDEWELSERIKAALAKIPESKKWHRNRVLRFGWDYEKPEIWLGQVPEWTRFALPEYVRDANNLSINEYLHGQSIAPHIDAHRFADQIAILSLLADATMRFTSPAGEIREFVLPRRSLAVMSGELRQTWQHETLPLEADLRYSLVYRKRLI